MRLFRIGYLEQVARGKVNDPSFYTLCAAAPTFYAEMASEVRRLLRCISELSPKQTVRICLMSDWGSSMRPALIDWILFKVRSAMPSGCLAVSKRCCEQKEKENAKSHSESLTHQEKILVEYYRPSVSRSGQPKSILGWKAWGPHERAERCGGPSLRSG